MVSILGYISGRKVASCLLLLVFGASGSGILGDGPHHQEALIAPAVEDTRPATDLQFQLRHVFVRGVKSDIHRRLDVHQAATIRIGEDKDDLDLWDMPQLRMRPSTWSIARMADRRSERIEALLEAGRRTGRALTLPESAWTIDDVRGPNVTDKQTILSMAYMAANAYVQSEDDTSWENVGHNFNRSLDFGWQADSLRGHIFADQTNSTIVIGLKGTSTAIFDGAGTTTKDKVNDNTFFSCCCGQGGASTWLQVCDCMTSTFTCNTTCIQQALRQKNHYYQAAQELYGNVSELYPNSDVWMTGHSLGGSISSLIGLTYGHPIVTFGAPGEAMPAARLGLPTHPGFRIGSKPNKTTKGAYHFGNTADPLFMGTCGGHFTTCSIAGYAMESRCHTGHVCVYDTVRDKGWNNWVYNHKIKVMVHDVLEAYDELAQCEEVSDCPDCASWKFFESNGTEPRKPHKTTKVSSIHFTQTRTETCRTPGWFGCLDPTSSAPTTTTTSAGLTTTTTSTCRTQGWFHCLDPTSTTITTTITSTDYTTTVTTTSTCHTPGFWFGCKDPSTGAAVKTSSMFSVTSHLPITVSPSLSLSIDTSTSTELPSSSSTCTTPGYVYGCWDAT